MCVYACVIECWRTSEDCCKSLCVSICMFNRVLAVHRRTVVSLFSVCEYACLIECWRTSEDCCKSVLYAWYHTLVL